MNDFLLMSRDTCIATIRDNLLEPVQPSLLPLFLQRTGDIRAWLEMRAVDSHRTNSRLLKRALRLENKDDLSTVLYVNAVTITDSYWVKPVDDNLSYEDVRFKTNLFDKLALNGDVNSFNQAPSRTPELTNTGSFEKCWRLIDGKWWLYKDGKPEERFSELLAFYIGRYLNFSVAYYEAADDYIRSSDFTDSASVNFEPIIGLVNDCSDYKKVLKALQNVTNDTQIQKILVRQYLQLCYFDALIFNMDRHEQNFGVLRDLNTGKVLSLAPLFDHNIALIARGYPKDTACKNDLLIHDFVDLAEAACIRLSVPRLTAANLRRIIDAIPVLPPTTQTVPKPKDYLVAYLLNRQARIQEQNRNLIQFHSKEDFCR